MLQMTHTDPIKSLRFDGVDMEIRAQMGQGDMTVDFVKGGTCVHTLVIKDAGTPLEHSWLADLFAREDKIELSRIAREADEYVSGLDINQG